METIPVRTSHRSARKTTLRVVRESQEKADNRRPNNLRAETLRGNVSVRAIATTIRPVGTTRASADHAAA